MVQIYDFHYWIENWFHLLSYFENSWHAKKPGCGRSYQYSFQKIIESWTMCQGGSDCLDGQVLLKKKKKIIGACEHWINLLWSHLGIFITPSSFFQWKVLSLPSQGCCYFHSFSSPGAEVSLRAIFRKWTISTAVTSGFPFALPSNSVPSNYQGHPVRGIWHMAPTLWLFICSCLRNLYHTGRQILRALQSS